MCDDFGGLWEWYTEKKNDPPCVKNWGRLGNKEHLEYMEFLLKWQRDTKENPDRIVTIGGPK